MTQRKRVSETCIQTSDRPTAAPATFGWQAADVVRVRWSPRLGGRQQPGSNSVPNTQLALLVGMAPKFVWRTNISVCAQERMHRREEYVWSFNLGIVAGIRYQQQLRVWQGVRKRACTRNRRRNTLLALDDERRHSQLSELRPNVVLPERSERRLVDDEVIAHAFRRPVAGTAAASAHVLWVCEELARVEIEEHLARGDRIARLRHFPRNRGELRAHAHCCVRFVEPGVHQGTGRRRRPQQHRRSTRSGCSDAYTTASSAPHDSPTSANCVRRSATRTASRSRTCSERVSRFGSLIICDRPPPRWSYITIRRSFALGCRSGQTALMFEPGPPCRTTAPACPDPTVR